MSKTSVKSRTDCLLPKSYRKLICSRQISLYWIENCSGWVHSTLRAYWIVWGLVAHFLLKVSYLILYQILRLKRHRINLILFLHIFYSLIALIWDSSCAWVFILRIVTNYISSVETLSLRPWSLSPIINRILFLIVAFLSTVVIMHGWIDNTLVINRSCYMCFVVPVFYDRSINWFNHVLSSV